MRKSYTVTGSSAVKPTNLPEGLSVQEKKVEIKETIKTGLSREITVQEVYAGAANLRVHSTFDGTTVAAQLTKEETTKLRDTLNEILRGNMRKVVDSSGYDDVWFEVETDRFLNHDTRADAERAFGRGNTGKSLDNIRRAYGVKKVTFE